MSVALAEDPEKRMKILMVMRRLENLWLKRPELRLGQLIINVFDDPYYVEDEQLITALEEFYQNNDPTIS